MSCTLERHVSMGYNVMQVPYIMAWCKPHEQMRQVAPLLFQSTDEGAYLKQGIFKVARYCHMYPKHLQYDWDPGNVMAGRSAKYPHCQVDPAHHTIMSRLASSWK